MQRSFFVRCVVAGLAVCAAGYAFKGTPRALLGHAITQSGTRPTFPAETPFEYRLLAMRCWESDAAIRCVHCTQLQAPAGGEAV